MVNDEEFYDEHFMGDEERFYDEHFYLYQIYRVLNFTVCTAEQANPPITIVGWQMSVDKPLFIIIIII